LFVLFLFLPDSDSFEEHAPQWLAIPPSSQTSDEDSATMKKRRAAARKAQMLALKHKSEQQRRQVFHHLRKYFKVAGKVLLNCLFC